MDKLLSVEEVSKVLMYTPITIKDKMRSGVLKGTKYKSRWFMRESDLNEYCKKTGLYQQPKEEDTTIKTILVSAGITLDQTQQRKLEEFLNVNSGLTKGAEK